MFATHKKLCGQLTDTINSLLLGDHPTLETLRGQAEKDVLWWELWTERKGYAGRSRWRGPDGSRMQFDMRPPTGEALLISTWRGDAPNRLPTLPSFNIDRGSIAAPDGSRTANVELQVSDGMLTRVAYRVEDGKPFPKSVRGWRTLVSDDLSGIPTFEPHDYAVLTDPFEKWLLTNVPHQPNGDPSRPIDSPQFPRSVGHFHRVFASVGLDDLSFFTPSECAEVDALGEIMWTFASDGGGDGCCMKPGQDRVFVLRHDPPEVEDTGLSFEEFVRHLVSEAEDNAAHCP
jgi:hypothetical protein